MKFGTSEMFARRVFLRKLGELGPTVALVGGNCDSNSDWPLVVDLVRNGVRFRLVHIPPSHGPENIDVLLHGHTHVPRNERPGPRSVYVETPLSFVRLSVKRDVADPLSRPIVASTPPILSAVRAIAARIAISMRPRTSSAAHRPDSRARHGPFLSNGRRARTWSRGATDVRNHRLVKLILRG